MIDFQNGLSFQNNMAYIAHPNFLISKNTVFSNLLNGTTSMTNHENCIWFRNNGEIWHTLYSINTGYKEITLNGIKCIVLMPQLIIHIGKNKFSKYDIEIYFKNNDCGSDEIIESFLKVDELDIVIDKSDYVEESSKIVSHLLSDYDFKYEADNASIQKSLNDHKKFFNGTVPLDTKLSQMIDIWKKDVDDHTNSNIIHNAMIHQKNVFVPISFSKKKFFMGILFETMKHIKLGNKRYIVYDIKCRDDLQESIDSKFKDDNILLYDFDSDKKITLSLNTIIESKFRSHDNGNNLISEKSIRVGGYLNFNGKQTARKIVDIELDKDKYLMRLYTEQRGYDSDSLIEDMTPYNIIEQPKNIYANDIYDILNIKDKEKKYPLFHIHKSTIVTKKNSDERYTLDEICDFVRTAVYYNKKEKVYFKPSHNDIFINMLKRISITDDEKTKINDHYNQYSYGFVPDGPYSSKLLIKLSKDLFIDTANHFIHITSDDDNLENKSVEEFSVNNVRMPCIVNDVTISNSDTYISHLNFSFNRRIVINDIYKNNRGLDCFYKTIDDMESKKFVIDDIAGHDFFADKRIEIDGLYIGQYGKIKNLGSVYGFKKSLWHGIKDFYERTFDGKKMVLFENNIAVSIDLIDLDYFNETSLKVKKKNDVFLSRYDFVRIKNSAKKLSGDIVQGNETIKCEIL